MKVGESVRVGETLGLLGNSGNSDAPHLHFQRDGQPRPPLGSNGLPYRFKRFCSEGTLKNFARVLVLGAKAKINPTPSGIHRREPRLNNEVVDFG